MPQNRLAHHVVADRYELLETVGRGGSGVVWRACDTLLQRNVAVKEIHIPAFLDPEDAAGMRETVLNEARAAARLDHPGAVTVFDVIDDDGHPVIVMELVEAPNLTELVSDHGPLAPDGAARIGLEVLDVLAAAHERGIVHRDVKPGNVMVSESGRVRLGDFGVAAILDDPTMTASGAITGSPAYMAPEQATNQGALPASDLWSLGATLYFAVEGRPPFDKGAPVPTMTSIIQDPPRRPERAGALGPVLDGLLVKEPRSRLSGRELQSRLERVATPAEEPAWAPVAPSRRRVTAGVGWAVASVVGVVLVAVIAYGLSSRGPDAPPDTAGDTSTSATPAPSTAPSGNWVGYTGPRTGFTISHPPGWTVRTDGTLTDFRDPDTGAYLRVDYVQPPGPSPEGAWFELERSFAAAHENYRRVRIEPTTYNGYRAAAWEFTYTAGDADLHVADLGFITPRYGFALYFQTRASDWDRLQPTFRAFKESFTAPA